MYLFRMRNPITRTTQATIQAVIARIPTKKTTKAQAKSWMKKQRRPNGNDSRNA